jgi:hypothetical protein
MRKEAKIVIQYLSYKANVALNLINGSKIKTMLRKQFLKINFIKSLKIK